MRFELVNVDGLVRAEGLPECFRMVEAYGKQVESVHPDFLPDFPYALLGYDSSGNEAIYFQENDAYEFLRSILIGTEAYLDLPETKEVK